MSLLLYKLSEVLMNLKLMPQGCQRKLSSNGTITQFSTGEFCLQHQDIDIKDPAFFSSDIVKKDTKIKYGVNVLLQCLKIKKKKRKETKKI